MATELSNWDYKNKHIDKDINHKDFLSSSRVILYAAKVDIEKSGNTPTYKTSEFKPIGVIQGYSFSEQRQMEQIFEIGSDVPYNVPGRAMGQLNISRILISGKDITNILFHGVTDGEVIPEEQIVRTLKDINKPFDLLFAAFSNENTNSASVIFSRLFRNCWITARQESITANQTIVAENVSIVYQDMPVATIKQN